MRSDKIITELDPYCRVFVESCFPAMKGKNTVCSEDVKIGFYLSTHYELLLNKLPRIIDKGKAETK